MASLVCAPNAVYSQNVRFFSLVSLFLRPLGHEVAKAGRILLGIDAGGTHTDAVLLEESPTGMLCQAQAKVPTNHEDLPASIRAVLNELSTRPHATALLTKVTHVTVGTTLAVNAIIQGKIAQVGLVVAAGPGLSPLHSTVGTSVVQVPGGLDHRGVQVTPLATQGLADTLALWRERGIREVVCVTKFSPRNSAHEQELGRICAEAGMHVTLGSSISGQLNFPRRIATAWYNAAVRTLHTNFVNAVEQALTDIGITAKIRFLKADGGAIPLELSRKEPVQSILSGPAASVMGILALAPDEDGTQLLLDVGGTTTDIALVFDGSPVLDRNGMRINGRRTLVRALASRSIGVGGDSRLSVTQSNGNAVVTTGPERVGNAMAFGGEVPTLLDALAFCDTSLEDPAAQARSCVGIREFATTHHMDPHDLAHAAIADAIDKITSAACALVDEINEHPIYTLKALRSYTKLVPTHIQLVGGPAACLRERLAAAFRLPVDIPEYADVANAIGAALTRPTEILEVYADSAKRVLRAPKLNHTENLPRSCTPTLVRDRAKALLKDHLAEHESDDAAVEVLEEDIFAVLDDYGASSRDIRITCQAQPGIIGKAAHAHRAL